MPRRPPKKSRTQGTTNKPRGVKRGDATLKRWERVEDIPMDEEDQFHASRDRILLEGEEEYDDGDEDEDEVFALKGVDPSSDEEEEEDYDGVDEDVEMEEADHVPVSSNSSKSKKLPDKKPKKAARGEEDEDEGSEEEDESWGKKKSAYYASNADEIESDDEEANEMEEQEARRLQRKTRDTLADDDFGLEDVAAVAEADEDLLEEPLEQTAPSVTLPGDKASLLRHLEKTSPETLALARDWDEVAWSVVRAQHKLEQMEKNAPKDVLALGMVHLHHQALLSYATTLAFYLHLRSIPKYVQKPESLRSHPIFSRLLTLKQSLATLEDLDFALSDDDDDDDDDESGDEDRGSLGSVDTADSGLEEEEEEDDEVMELDLNRAQLHRIARRQGLDAGELEALLQDAQSVWEADAPAAPTKQRGPKQAAKTPGASDGEPSKKKRKTSAVTSAPVVFDLVEPEYIHPSKSSSSSRNAATASRSADMATAGADPYGELSELTAADAKDKSARRRSLQFYTQKLDSAHARREGARRTAAGGDDDIPYKTGATARRIDGEAKQKQKQGARGADLESGPHEEEGDRGGSESAQEEEDAGYYSLVRAGKKVAKAEKQAAYDTARAAERASVAAEDAEDASGPRGVSRAILKNKGLTPTRSKSVRNPRVKKRIKFDAAKKKLASQKPVYVAGKDGSRYEGERSGISRVVKSVKLS